MRTLISLVFVSLLTVPLRLDAQAPAAQAPADCSPSTGVTFVCGLQAPEDLAVVPGAQWVVAGAYAGRGGIYLIQATDRKPILAYPAANAAGAARRDVYKACPGAPDASTKAKFQTHGLYLLPARTPCIACSWCFTAAASRWRSSRSTHVSPRLRSPG